MGYQKLTPGQEEQIAKMRDEGKTPQEVCDFFKATYHIKLEPWKVSYITGKVKAEFRRGGEGVASAENPRRKKANKKYYAKKNAAPVSDDVDVQELVTLLTQIDAGYKKLLEHFKGTLKQLRNELIKSRGQVNEMLKGAGIEAED